MLRLLLLLLLLPLDAVGVAWHGLLLGFLVYVALATFVIGYMVWLNDETKQTLTSRCGGRCWYGAHHPVACTRPCKLSRLH